MAFPDHDRWQAINEVAPYCPECQGRTQARVMRHPAMRAGPPNKARHAFYAICMVNDAADPNVDPANMSISIVENQGIGCSFRDGVVQFVV